MKHKRGIVVGVGLTAIAVVILLFSAYGSQLAVRISAPSDTTSHDDLLRPLRLQAAGSNAFEEFVIALRTFHYRTQLRGVVIYSDVFYDTADWRLYNSGYSYRFRAKKADGGESAGYSIRFERERRFEAEGAKPIDLRASLPSQLGEVIESGSWQRAVSNDVGLEIMAQLRPALQDLGVLPEALQPKLVAELERRRFDVTDKGRNWFELDHEIWFFHVPEKRDHGSKFEDIVLDTRLKRNDPELVRRVRTLVELSKMTHGVRKTDRAPHERAIELLRTNPPSFSDSAFQ